MLDDTVSHSGIPPRHCCLKCKVKLLHIRFFKDLRFNISLGASLCLICIRRLEKHVLLIRL